MKTITKTSIEPGELTERRGAIYVATRRKRQRPCIEQCDLRGISLHAHCDGYCWRWANGDDIVFRYHKPVAVLSVADNTEEVLSVADNTEVVQTPSWIDERKSRHLADIAERAAAKYKETHDIKPKERKRGSVYKRTGRSGWQASITIDGKKYTFSSLDKAVCQKWLDDFKKERGINL